MLPKYNHKNMDFKGYGQRRVKRYNNNNNNNNLWNKRKSGSCAKEFQDNDADYIR